jgi:hypothetical protein
MGADRKRFEYEGGTLVRRCPFLGATYRVATDGVFHVEFEAAGLKHRMLELQSGPTAQVRLKKLYEDVADSRFLYREVWPVLKLSKELQAAFDAEYHSNVLCRDFAKLDQLYREVSAYDRRHYLHMQHVSDFRVRCTSSPDADQRRQTIKTIFDLLQVAINNGVAQLKAERPELMAQQPVQHVVEPEYIDGVRLPPDPLADVYE